MSVPLEKDECVLVISSHHCLDLRKRTVQKDGVAVDYLGRREPGIGMLHAAGAVQGRREGWRDSTNVILPSKGTQSEDGEVGILCRTLGCGDSPRRTGRVAISTVSQ